MSTVEIITCEPVGASEILDIAGCLRAAGLRADFDGCAGGGTLTRFTIAEARDAEAVQREIEGCLAELLLEWERMTIRTPGVTVFIEPQTEVEA